VRDSAQAFRRLCVDTARLCIRRLRRCGATGTNATADSASLLRWGAWLTAATRVRTELRLCEPVQAKRRRLDFDGLDVGMRILWTAKRYALSAKECFGPLPESGAPANQYRVARVIDLEVQRGCGSRARSDAITVPRSRQSDCAVGPFDERSGERISVRFAQCAKNGRSAAGSACDPATATPPERGDVPQFSSTLCT